MPSVWPITQCIYAYTLVALVALCMYTHNSYGFWAWLVTYTIPLMHQFERSICDNYGHLVRQKMLQVFVQKPLWCTSHVLT